MRSCWRGGEEELLKRRDQICWRRGAREGGATMVGSTAAPPPSPHRDCPTEILDGDAVPPPPPSRVEATVSPSVPLSIGAVVSSPSTLVRAAATKNKGHASIEEVAAAAALCALYPVTQDPHQGCGVPGEKQRLPKPPPKKRLRSPLVVPVVGSPGVNVVLSQASPRYGVKRSSPTPPQIPCLPRRNKKRKLKSEIWNDFDPVYDGNKLKEAKCKHCKRIFMVARKVGTSECIRHLLVCEERAKVNEFLDSIKSAMPQPDSKSEEKWNYDPEKSSLGVGEDDRRA